MARVESRGEASEAIAWGPCHNENQLFALMLIGSLKKLTLFLTLLQCSYYRLFCMSQGYLKRSFIYP